MFKKKYEDLNFTDDFMFGRILRSDKSLCIGILELLLDIKIKDISYSEDQKTIKNFYDAKGIRLDVYAEDENNTIYDIEMQTTDKYELPKRSRYYQSSIDAHLIEEGSSYRELNKSYVIFICLNDPFGYSLPMYTFENRCNQNHDIKLKDDAFKVFINADGNRDNLSKDMADFLNYLKTHKPNSKLTDKIDIAVNKAISQKEWEGDYVTLQMYVDDMLAGQKDALIAQGIAQGREEGREEGLIEAYNRMVANGTPESEAKRILRIQ